MTIAVNCVLLALNTPLPQYDKSKLNLQLEKAEIYLLAIFIVEALLKIVTRGFILHPGSYLRNAWNVLDFVVVVTGIMSLPYLNLDIDANALKALRAGRVLRPLKLVSGIPSLQVVMKSIMRAMAPLLQICLLVIFVIIIYSIIGLEFLNGSFHYSCRDNNSALMDGEHQLCSPEGLGYQCPPGYECKRYWDGPNKGITSFDNMLLSMLTVFTCITCEGWTDTMYWTFDVADKNGYIFWIYYFSLNIIGAQFMLNLVLGVLSGEFGKERERVENRTAFLLLRQGQQVDRALTGYMDWIDTAEKAIIEEEDEEDEEHTQFRSSRTKGNTGNLGMTKVLTKNAAGKNFRLNIHGKEKKKPWKEIFRKKNRRMKIRIKKVVEHAVFYWLVITCVFLNTISVAAEYYLQPQWLTDLQDIAEIIFLSFFLMEMCLKLYGLGPRLYFRSKFNKFDSLVVTAGVFELILYKKYGISMGISVLRALRLLRLFKFTRYWKSLKNLITSLLSSMKSIISLLFLLFLFILIYALLGMQLFGGSFAKTIPQPRTNFDDFGNAMLAVFQILTGEDWNMVMYEGVTAYHGPKTPKGLAIAFIYFVTLVILGNYTLLNVFLAIAVDNLTNAQEIGDDEKAEEREREKHKQEIKEKYAPKAGAGRNLDVYYKDSGMNGSTISEFDRIPNDGGRSQPGHDWVKNLKQPGRMTGNIRGGEGTEMIQTNTLFIFSPQNPIRQRIHNFVASKYFDNTILILILISSGFLALENTIDKDATINKVLWKFDYVFTSIFALEVILKVVDSGVILHKGSYFRDVWNCTDALVVCCAIASMVLSSSKSSSSSQQVVKVLRVLRVLRPFKAINKTKKLKAVFQCMVYSLKNVINILVITIQFLFIFAVIGVQLFAGKFYYCTDESKMHRDECYGYYITFKDSNYNQPRQEPREWKNQVFNFDNVKNALVTLFTSSTGEGWPNVMFNAIDSTDINKGPILNNQIEVAFFFALFVVVFSFFFINIFVALIILTFQEQGEAEEGDCELDRNQRGCLRDAMEKKPAERFMPENPNSFQYKVWQFVDSVPFEYFIMLLIGGNTLILMLKYDSQPEAYGKYLDVVNVIFTFLFTGEFMLKVFALRQNYFRDGWNVFDFIIVLGSLLDFIFSKTFTTQKIPFDPSVFRLFRAARLIKLLRRGYTIRILLWTFLQSFKSLPYVGMLIFLIFFIYAIIGMQLFSLIAIDIEDEPWMYIDRHNNFRGFFPAFQVLFRSATGENWHNIMLACSADARCDPKLPAVDPGQEYCGSSLAHAYFISFIFVCSFLMLNLFVAVIMDNFGYLTQDESILGPHHLDEFVRVWALFDPRATGRIKHTEVCLLLRQMSPPIGLGTKCPKVVAYKRLIRMNMPLHPDNTVDFTATLFALVRTALNIMTEKNNLHSNDVDLRNMLKRVWPNITKKTLDRVVPKRPQGGNQMTVGKIYCAKLIYENYKHVKKSGRKNKMNLSNGNSVRKETIDDVQQPPPPRKKSVPTNDFLGVNGSANYNLSTPNLTNFYEPQLISSPHRLSQSTYSINNDLAYDNNPQIPRATTNKQQIALAIKSGKSPYEIYGLPDNNEDDDWC
eukprot:TCONS_00007303-protein